MTVLPRPTELDEPRGVPPLDAASPPAGSDPSTSLTDAGPPAGSHPNTTVTTQSSGRLAPPPPRLAPPVPVVTRIAPAARPTRVPADPAAHAAAHGRVAEHGEVYVRLPQGGEHQVGTWAAGDPVQAFAFYGVKYADMLTDIEVTLVRIQEGRGRPEDATRLAARYAEQSQQPTCVGDLAALDAALSDLAAAAAEAVNRIAAERAEQRAAALIERTELVERAEALAESTAWRATGEEFRTLVAQWQSGTRLDRSAEQALWQRLARARATFDRRRKAHFTELTRSQAEGRSARAALVARAEALSTSRDWAATARAFRDIVTEWKAAPRASREDEQRLWQRLSAAQRTFFDARTAALAASAQASASSLAARTAVVARAEALLPCTDPAAAMTALRALTEEYSQCAPLPPKERQACDRRLRAVEEAIRTAARRDHQRTDPAKAERARTTLRLLGGRLERLRADLQTATTDEQRTRLTSDIAQQQALVDAAEAALADFLRP